MYAKPRVWPRFSRTYGGCLLDFAGRPAGLWRSHQRIVPRPWQSDGCRFDPSELGRARPQRHTAVFRHGNGKLEYRCHLVGERRRHLPGRALHRREHRRKLCRHRDQRGRRLQVGAGSGERLGRGAASGTASSITKDGITWTFSQPALVGQFVTGDYYVVGPVTVTAIDPAPTTSAPYLNGSVVNLPTANSKSGFDSRLNDGTDESWWFDASLRSYPPISLKPGDALVSSISLAQIHSLPEVMRASDMSASPVQTVSVLTVVSAAPSADAFRPSYCDRSQTIYHAGALQRNLLPSLAPPNPSATPRWRNSRPGTAGPGSTPTPSSLMRPPNTCPAMASTSPSPTPMPRCC